MNSELFHINIHEIPGRRKFYLHKLLLQSFVRVETTELLDRFEQVLQRCDSDVIDTLTQQYSDEQRSLYIDWEDLYR